MKRVFIGMVACGALLGGTAAFAASSYSNGNYGAETSSAHQAPWEQTQPAYKASAPDTMKCSEFVSSDVNTQNYVSAWLDGHRDRNTKAHKRAGGEPYVPSSVLTLNTACKSNPGTTVMAMAERMHRTQ